MRTRESLFDRDVNSQAATANDSNGAIQIVEIRIVSVVSSTVLVAATHPYCVQATKEYIMLQ